MLIKLDDNYVIHRGPNYSSLNLINGDVCDELIIAKRPKWIDYGHPNFDCYEDAEDGYFEDNTPDNLPYLVKIDWERELEYLSLHLETMWNEHRNEVDSHAYPSSNKS